MKNPAYPQSAHDIMLPTDFYLSKYDDPENTVSLDFETYYDPKEYSVGTMGAVAYANDERANIYLLSANGRLDGKPVAWVGHPLDFPHWEYLRDNRVRITAANAEFDETVAWAFLTHEKGWSPEDARRVEFMCTLDLARYNTLSGNLAGAVADAGLADALPKIDKSVRAEMAGHTFRHGEPVPQRFVDYALVDAIADSALWSRYAASWPDFERWYSVLNRRRNVRGVPIDPDKLDAGIRELRRAKFEMEQAIPWEWPDGKTPRSPKAFRLECRKHGLQPPPSLAAKDNPAFETFREEHGGNFPFIAAYVDWGKANRMEKKLLAFRDRLTPCDQMPFEQRYFGAHTGRGAGGRGRGAGEGGGTGVNMQNLAKQKIGNVGEREVIVAPKGYVFLVADYGQIEPRLLYLRAGMNDMLDLIRQGYQVYEAYARRNMGYNLDTPLKSTDPVKYLIAKGCVIGLGYGCGWRKAMQMFFQGFPPEQVQQYVADFRSSNPQIPNYWYEHERWLTFSAEQKDDTHEVELLSGRHLRYFRPRMGQKPDGRWGVFFRPTPRAEIKGIWGGTLTENEIQATAGDVLRTGLRGLEPEFQNRWLMDIHDEVVFMLPESEAEDMRDHIIRGMTTIPWLPEDFPLEMSGDLVPFYQKVD